MTPLLTTSSAGKVAVGLVAGVIGSMLLRPAIVGVVRAGLAIKDVTKSAVDSVSAEAHKIHAEAKAHRAATVVAETEKIQSDIDKNKAG